MTDTTQEGQLAPFAIESAQTESEIEDRLKNEIKSLWSVHQEGKARAQKTKEQMKTLRLDLGQKLCEMKAILARTGRSGRWAAYLRSQDLPRATAERYIDRHEALSNPKQIESCEAIPETTAEDVRRLVRNLMPRLRRVLKTQSWMEWFLTEVQYQWETADSDSTGGRVNDSGPVAEGDSGDPNGTEATALSAAA
jgi:hypothetical protein